MLKDKLNMVFNYNETNSNQFCKNSDIKQANYSYKAINNKFYLSEAIQIAEFTNTRLAFIDENNNPIVIFGKNDIKK